MEKSPMYSLKGWNIIKWIDGVVMIKPVVQANWDSILEIGKWAAPGILAYIASYNPVLEVPAVILGKALLDIVHYWLKNK